MNNKIRDKLIIIVATVIALIFSFYCWKLERYLNWKFGYKSRVEQRIVLIEERVKKIEEELRVI